MFFGGTVVGGGGGGHSDDGSEKRETRNQREVIDGGVKGEWELGWWFSGWCLRGGRVGERSRKRSVIALRI